MGTIFIALPNAKVKAKAKATVKDRTNDRAIGLYGNQGLLQAKPLSRVLSIVLSKYQEAALSKHLKLTLVNSKEVLW